MLKDVMMASKSDPTLTLHMKTDKPFSRIRKFSDRNIRIPLVDDNRYLSLQPDYRRYP